MSAFGTTQGEPSFLEIARFQSAVPLSQGRGVLTAGQAREVAIVQAARSCHLTAAINGLLFARQIYGIQAPGLQRELLTIPAYARSREDGRSGPNARWSNPHSSDVVWAAQRLTGQPIHFDFEPTPDIAVLAAKMRLGGVLVAHTATHAVTAFSPMDRDQVGVYDPQVPNRPYFHNFDEVPNVLSGLAITHAVIF